MNFFRVYLRSLGILWFEERKLTCFLILASLTVGALQALEPVFFGRVIDSLSNRDRVIEVLAFWGLLTGVNIAASVFLAVMSDRLAHRQRLNVLDWAFSRVIALPVSYHSEQGSSRVVHNILSGSDHLFHVWLSFMREHLASIIGIIFLIPIALSIQPSIAFLLLFLAVLYMIANFFIVRRTHLAQERVEVYHQNLFARIGDVLGNVNIVQSYTRLFDEIQALQQITTQLLTAQYPILTWWGILAVITRLASSLTMVTILAYGAWLVQQNEMTVGQVVAFVGFSGVLISRLEQVSGFISRIISRTPALQNFFLLLDQQGGTHETPHAKIISHVQGQVVFENVTYTHKNSRYGVFNLNFTIPAGQTVALVGPSGSGKTTTMALLQRLFDPQSGTITIDGENIQNFTLSSLRAAIATVFQDAGLFNRSILENIRVGRPQASDKEVQSAAEQADAHEFILAKPGGYDFIIGERGGALSGGERQRIAIARAILKNAPIVIFDEATSALDNRTEKKIQHAIANLRAQNRTTFIIAHRLSTVISADHILVFDHGHIVETGTFKELLAKNGLFATFVKLGELDLESHQGGCDARA